MAKKSETEWGVGRDKIEARADALKGSAGGAGDWAQITALERAEAAGKAPTEAEILQAADPAATQAGMVGQTAGGEAAQMALGLGGGAIHAGRAAATAAALGFDPNAASRASLDARQLTNQIRMQQYEAEMARVMGQAQFDKSQSNALWGRLMPSLSVSTPT
tara:strand:+ start:5468 stop:5953 length:486 start_codon:yes stop_codon:yes gene_type:complete